MAVCKCGERRYASFAEALIAEPESRFKCPTCRTFATDHEWVPGFDPDENRCGDCDIRANSHGRGPR